MAGCRITYIYIYIYIVTTQWRYINKRRSLPSALLLRSFIGIGHACIYNARCMHAMVTYTKVVQYGTRLYGLAASRKQLAIHTHTRERRVRVRHANVRTYGDSSWAAQHSSSIDQLGSARVVLVYVIRPHGQHARGAAAAQRRGRARSGSASGPSGWRR